MVWVMSIDMKSDPKQHISIARRRYETAFNTEMQRIDGNCQCPLQAGCQQNIHQENTYLAEVFAVRFLYHLIVVLLQCFHFIPSAPRRRSVVSMIASMPTSTNERPSRSGVKRVVKPPPGSPDLLRETPKEQGGFRTF